MSIEVDIEMAHEPDLAELQRATEALLGEQLGVAIVIEAENGELDSMTPGVLTRFSVWRVGAGAILRAESNAAVIDLCSILLPAYKSDVTLTISVSARNPGSSVLMMAAAIAAAQTSGARVIIDEANMFGLGRGLTPDQLLGRMTAAMKEP